jgi:2-ketocyclohexanecarboxyl-CoA hydrolase
MRVNDPRVTTERDGTTTTIRLSADQRGAYDAPMARAVTDALHDVAATRVFVITGTDGSFCAGGALTELSMPTTEGMRELYRGSIEMFDAIRGCPRPVIAAVGGPAAGGGNELVVACDLAIAARSATFGQTGPRVGSAPVTGGTNLMALQIGEKRAKELSFMCRRYTAEQALAMGLVNEVVEDEALADETRCWCDELAALSPRYLEIAKTSSNVWFNAARDSFTTGIGMLLQAVGSEDMVEGAQAFLEKRPPRFAFPSRPDPTSPEKRRRR